MKLQFYIYDCIGCQKQFKVPRLPVNPYGEFLLTSETGDVTYLNADIKEFSEISELVDENKRIKKMSDDKRADIFSEIYGYICDLAPDDSRYDMFGLPLCPYCHSSKNLEWEPSYPPEYVYEEVKALPHHRWNQLTENEKKELIDNEIKLALEGKFSNYLKSK
jgi:hypothetical protein